MLVDSCVVVFPLALLGLLLLMGWLEDKLNATLLGDEIHDYLASGVDPDSTEERAARRLEEVLRHRQVR